ncbi:MAG: MurR/RpiR family transcriptional regulator [Synergistaceae bacterium]|nr:MurR/RpiR family transcriptional regulator [Synergistaceae bacterium]
MSKMESIAERQSNVFSTLNAAAQNLPHRQRELCAYILSHYQEAAFYSMEALAEASNTSLSTVVRTTKALGYDTYRDLQKDMHKTLFKNNFSVWWELERSLDNFSEDDPEESTFTWVARDNVEAVQNTATPQLLNDFKIVADILDGAGKIGIFGTRSTKAVAFYFYYMLQQFSHNAFLLDAIGSDQLYDELLNFTPNDVLFMLSLGWPHFATRTLNAVEFAAKNKLPTILITNHPVCPAVQHANITLYAAPTQRHYSLVPVLTLIEGLVVELGRRKKSAARTKIRRIEQVLTEENVTYKPNSQ